MSDFAKTIKLNILRILAEQSISKNELSRRTGISQGSLVALLNGDREVQTDTVQKIADALGVSTNDVVMIHEDAHS